METTNESTGRIEPMAGHFNGLSPAEDERLAVLLEECGEVIQIIGKIQRHGYENFNPFDDDKTTNRQLLEKEMGHYGAAMGLLIQNKDVDWKKCNEHDVEKQESIKQWLHHQ